LYHYFQGNDFPQGGYILRSSILTCFIIAAFYGSAACECAVKPVFNRDFSGQLIRLLDSAKSTAYIAHLYFKDDAETSAVKRSVAEAVKRDVSVKIVLEDSFPENKQAVEFFKSIGADASLDTPNKQLHCKLVVVDGERTLVGSSNLSAKSMSENNETNALITCPDMAGFTKCFSLR